jgi:hypothetical protein
MSQPRSGVRLFMTNLTMRPLPQIPPTATSTPTRPPRCSRVARRRRWSTPDDGDRCAGHPRRGRRGCSDSGKQALFHSKGCRSADGHRRLGSAATARGLRRKRRRRRGRRRFPADGARAGIARPRSLARARRQQPAGKAAEIPQVTLDHAHAKGHVTDWERRERRRLHPYLWRQGNHGDKGA